ncbi:pilus assembly protein TadG-related protein [Leifsonia sp. YAF41]|uniref:pilus assembly protein TadG-related protein n=1 Tax=Leifsonia sp. YAF41 TaxID=3233086 RepID=UPI003F9519A5
MTSRRQVPRPRRPAARLNYWLVHRLRSGHAPADADAGSTLLLTIFYGFLATVLILTCVAATSLYLERKRLFTLADGAALAGAEAFDLDDVTVEAGELRARLESSRVEQAAEEFLTATPQAGFDDLTMVSAASPDGRSATVSLRSTWRPPVLALLLPAGIPLEVTAVARSVFW